MPLAQDLIASSFTNAERHGGSSSKSGWVLERLRDALGIEGADLFGPARVWQSLTPNPTQTDPPPRWQPASGVGVLLSAVVPGREVFEVVRTGTTTRAYVHDGGPDRFDLVVQIVEGHPAAPLSTLPVRVLAEGSRVGRRVRHGAHTSCPVPSGACLA